MTAKVTKREALDYHSQGRPGKIALEITKPCATQRDLTMAYSPGVAEPVRAIAEDPDQAYAYTAKGNLVAVVSNGTAVLGLGNVGALAGKPVMEGKGVLFKRFADIDVYDIELDVSDPDEVVRVVRALGPTFGGINLEDIKAPDCFYIERRLREEMDIPVFHDDQHGTAIIVGAGLLNAIEIAGKRLDEALIVVNGAGAAAIATADFLLRLGVQAENLTVCDSKGVIYKGRPENMNEYKETFARETEMRTLADAVAGADAFVGLSVAGALTPEMVRSMGPQPVIFALANPDPEISYDEAKAARPDAIVATGRSDYPNQVNNVLGFPFIFRGALDVRARTINEEMKVACAQALAKLARENVPHSVCRLYGVEALHFGPEYIIPKALDARVLTWVAPAVAQAAMDSGVARAPVDSEEYRLRLESRFSRSRQVQRRFTEQAQQQPKRVVFAEGEETSVIRAALALQREGVARPILVGRPDVIGSRVAQLGNSGSLEVVDPATAPELTKYGNALFALRQRKGCTRQEAFHSIIQPTFFAAMMVRQGAADLMAAGVTQSTDTVVRESLKVIGGHPDVERAAGLYMVIVRDELYFFTDPVINIEPTARELAAIAIEAGARVKRMGITPKIAMLSFSNFGSLRHPLSDKMRLAAELVKERQPELIVDGEMKADTAVVAEILERDYPFSDLTGAANILVFPDLQAASIALRLLHRLGGAEIMGPILLGMAKPVCVLPRRAEAGDIVTLTTMAVADLVR